MTLHTLTRLTIEASRASSGPAGVGQVCAADQAHETGVGVAVLLAGLPTAPLRSLAIRASRHVPMRKIIGGTSTIEHAAACVTASSLLPSFCLL